MGCPSKREANFSRSSEFCKSSRAEAFLKKTNAPPTKTVNGASGLRRERQSVQHQFVKKLHEGVRVLESALIGQHGLREDEV